MVEDIFFTKGIGFERDLFLALHFLVEPCCILLTYLWASGMTVEMQSNVWYGEHEMSIGKI